MQRPVTCKLLASAIEYAAQGKLKFLEHERFFVTHYHDKRMENARCETVRILSSGKFPLPKKAQAELQKIATALRTSA